jgi:hypothetical protein
MGKSLITKKVVRASGNSADPATGMSPPMVLAEMPETPRLNLPKGKISTATRRQLLPFTVGGADAAEKN